MKKANEKSMTIKLSAELLDAAQQSALSQDLTLSQWVRRAMKAKLDTETSKQS